MGLRVKPAMTAETETLIGGGGFEYKNNNRIFKMA